jgi:uncharacterized protein (TIGR00266 family)
MEVTVRHNPSFALARCELEHTEKVRVESGAMVAMSAGMGIESKMEGGFMKALKRTALSGESFFISTYTAPAGGGWVDIAPNLPGDVVVAGVLPDRPMNVTKGCWLASSMGIELDTQWGGFKQMAGGEGGFMVHAHGHGTILMACYGALDTVNLAPRESVTIDTGHVVAYEPTVQFKLRKVASGMMQTLKSGEGMVFDFTGPGWVMTQSRNPSALIALLSRGRS